MGSFQKIVLVIAVVLLLIILIIVAMSLSAANDDQPWPPSVPSCPDWWISDGSGNKSKCINVKGLGTCDEKEKNFNGPVFSGSNGTCAKYTWARKCKVAWDGITYGVDNPCERAA